MNQRFSPPLLIGKNVIYFLCDIFYHGRSVGKRPIPRLFFRWTRVLHQQLPPLRLFEFDLFRHFCFRKRNNRCGWRWFRRRWSRRPRQSKRKLR